jgi:hypothetical protein
MQGAPGGPPQDEDATDGLPIFIVRPSENVYSYFMFIGPTEAKRAEVKRGRTPRVGDDAGGSAWDINWDVAMGYLLVIMNFFMQTVLLYLIFEEVVVSNVDWQNGIMKLGGKGDRIMGLIAETPGECNDGQALCFTDFHGDYTCAPPTVQIVGRWEELDTNKDGIWSREEVVKSQQELQCKYVVDPVVVFDVLIAMLKERADKIWLHPDLLAGNMIHSPYFTYIMADVIMCSYRSKDMCSNLLERGFFDAPLKHGTAPRVGTTIDSALKYCNNLLAPGGMCERNLPSTYAVWKITSQEECADPSYEMFKYTNPGNNATKSLLRVDYSARQEYELAQEFLFMLFKGIIVFTWLLAMVAEYKDIIKILTLCARINDAEIYGDDAVLVERDPADPEDVRYRIQGITKRHRYTVIFVSILRSIVTLVLLGVGVSYLIKTNGYADLIMNGVALGFIAEISGVLFSEVLREEVKDQTEDIKPIKVEMYGIEWLNRRPALIDILCVVGIGLAVVAIMWWQQKNIVVPVYKALECTCLSHGDECFEAQKYNFDFWYEYWLHGVPGVFKAVETLKAGAPGAAGASYLMLNATSLRADMTAKERATAEVLQDLEGNMAELEELQAQEIAESNEPKVPAQQKIARARRTGQAPLRPA